MHTGCSMFYLRYVAPSAQIHTYSMVPPRPAEGLRSLHFNWSSSLSVETFVALFWWCSKYIPHIIHVWYIFLHSAQLYSKCR